MELNLESKRRIFAGGLALLFLVLIGRFAYVQLFKGEQFLEEANKNRVRIIDVDPPRGLIRDRFGEVLVENSPAYAIYAVPAEIRNAPEAYQIISTALRMSPDDLKQQIAKNKRGNFTPVKIGRQVDFAAFSLLNERRLELTGVDFRAESRRMYNHGVKAPHLFGYLSEISDAELNLYGNNYSPGDLIGKKGIERQYERIMRGEKGIASSKSMPSGASFVISPGRIPPSSKTRSLSRARIYCSGLMPRCNVCSKRNWPAKTAGRWC